MRPLRPGSRPDHAPRAIGRRRRPRRLLALLLLPALLGGAALAPGADPAVPQTPHAGRLARLLGLSVREIHVRGLQRTAPGEVRRMLADLKGSDILAVDLAEAERRLESLPWIEDARIRRLLPDRLMVEIRERRPTALWQGPEGAAVVDERGRVVVTAPPPGSGLPWLFGAGAPQAWPALREALARHPGLARRVEAAVRVGGRRWNLLIDGRIEVRLPEDDVAGALARLARLEAEGRLLERAVAAVDLRHPRLVAVEPDGTVLAAAAGGRT